MTDEQRLRNLQQPTGIVDVVLDTDTYNETDDQYALSLLMKSPERCHVQGLFAAPFAPIFANHSKDPEDGMERSYEEILHLLHLLDMDDKKDLVFKGSRHFMENEKTPVESPAARELCRLAMEHSIEKPLYVVSIGCITNVASAIVMQPEIAERIVIVWLGGHARNWPETAEYNMMQDIAAARVVFSCGAPLVQLPCMGVVSACYISGPELEYWLKGKNALCDYLVEHTVEEANGYAAGKVWSRVVWDITAVAWLLNDNDRYMVSRLEPVLVPEYDNRYALPTDTYLYRYVWHIKRDALFNDVFAKLAK